MISPINSVNFKGHILGMGQWHSHGYAYPRGGTYSHERERDLVQRAIELTERKEREYRCGLMSNEEYSRFCKTSLTDRIRYLDGRSSYLY